MDKEEILNILLHGNIEVVGRITWGSNLTFLTKVQGGIDAIEAVYKPQRGERPLWDFPEETLAGREVAAFVVSEALGWDLVPPTMFRTDAPLGPGSLQFRVAHDPERHYFVFDDETRQRLRPVALFDIIVNNADRKGGHILIDSTDKLWLIDHGICFHAKPKLRTVVWDFVGEEIPGLLLEDVYALREKLQMGLKEVLSSYLSIAELLALEQRVESLLAECIFPSPAIGERSTPWPLI